MTFDDPIYLDHDATDDLMADTEQRRMCWMHHDVLSDAAMARMFADYAGPGAPAGEAWTVMAWVAAGRQEEGFYLLFKWYEDFYGPPERGDLYYIQRDHGQDGEVRVRYLRMEVLRDLGPRGQELCNALWSKVSENATDFFGESDFDTNAITYILRLLDGGLGQELETFDWYLGRRSDGGKAAQCRTIAAYFHGLLAVHEVIYDLVVTDGVDYEGHRGNTRELLGILDRLAAVLPDRRLPELAQVFLALGEEFLGEPVKGPELSRNACRALMDLSRAEQIQWVRLSGQGRKKLLRELYCRCDPAAAWDVFHRWQGDLYFTVVQRPVIRSLRRGVYLLSRFEDQTGMDVTDLFWLENLEGGVIHRCEGPFFGDLLDQLLATSCPEITLHGGRRRAEDLIAAYALLLKEAYDKLIRGAGQKRPGDLDRIV